MRLSLSKVLFKAHYFTTIQPFGPSGEFGSFKPVKVEFDEEENKWVIICTFKKDGRELKAKVVIDDESGEIIGYEELEG